MPEERVRARRGFFPVVVGEDVSVQQAGGTVFVSKANTDITQGGAQVVLNGGNASIHQGGAQVLASGGDVSISQGGALFALARGIRAEQSYIGVALGRAVNLADSKVVLGPREAAVFGAVAGTAAAVMMRLLRR
jgi:hypothetical protein